MTTWYRTAILALAALIGMWATVAQADDTTLLGSGQTPPPEGTITRTPPVPVIDFPDAIPMHNMSIASDGTFYYTSNGGNAGYGQINTYNLSGVLQHSTPCYLDMRAIFWNFADSHLYAKAYGGDLYRVDPASGATTLIHSGIFAYAQSSPALSLDGQTLIEHESGTVRFISFQTGQLISTLTGFYFGSYPSNETVGVSCNWIFTWDGTMVHVYDFAGNPVESYTIPNGHYGFSLKFVNGLLFASDDGGGATGHWYGYDVGAAPSPTEPATWGEVKGLFR